MGKLDQLYTYQSADMNVLKHENEMRRDPTRTKLLRLRNFVIDQTNAVQQLDEAGEKSRERIAVIEKDQQALTAKIEQGMKRLEESALETAEDVRAAIIEAQRVVDGQKNAERELKKIIADAKAMDAKLKDIRAKVAQAKQQYAELKAPYDAEYAKQTEKLNALKEKRRQCGEGLEPALLKRYEQIRQQCTPPVAKLNGDRCGGCNMSLPAAIVKNVRDETSVIECENCGRILMVLDK